MSCSGLYTPQLRARGFRMTPQRMAILHVLHNSDEHLSPTEIYERASSHLPGLTETTVYRTLDFLAENGLALPAHVGSGRLVYEIAQQDHHHLICRSCGQSVHIDHAQLENVYANLESSSGFKAINSHVTFFGICPDCQEQSTGG